MTGLRFWWFQKVAAFKRGRYERHRARVRRSLNVGTRVAGTLGKSFKK